MTRSIHLYRKYDCIIFMFFGLERVASRHQSYFEQKHPLNQNTPLFFNILSSGTKYLKNKNLYSLTTGAEIAEYDHKSSNNANNSFSNCQALCPACHRRKSSAEHGSKKTIRKMREGQESSKAKKLQSNASRRKEVDKYTFRL